MSHKKLAPSLLSANFINLKEDLKILETEKVDLLHLDVMDGHFVPNLSFGLPFIKAVRQESNIPLDVHLMISNPEIYLKRYIEAGAARLSFHIEACTNPSPLISTIQTEGAKAGLALNPETPLENIEPFLKDLDFVLVMSVRPGFGGQKYISSVEDKIIRLDKLRRKKKTKESLEIAIDGGIGPENIASLAKLGVDIFVAGSSVFKKPSISSNIHTLREKLS